METYTELRTELFEQIYKLRKGKNRRNRINPTRVRLSFSQDATVKKHANSRELWVGLGGKIFWYGCALEPAKDVESIDVSGEPF